MEPSVFRYILRFSKREQVFLVLATAVSLPFLYVSYDLPKTIVNEAIGGADFPRVVFGTELEQIPFLLSLCFGFLALVFVNGGFKYAINVYRGVVGERMLRRLRYMLVERTLRFPLPHFRNVSQGEIVSMVTTETEPLGGFMGDAFSLLAHQGGTLLVLLGFIFVQDPFMGAAAIALYPLQAYLIPKLQRRVNALGKQRVQAVRKLSERLGETVSGVQDVRAHYTYQYELADYSDRLGSIFDIRYRIYRLKFFIKFLNNFLAQLTPFFFYSIGGYFVIQGELTIGALLAVIAAYKDIAAPWKELLAYYQRMEDARIKYDQLIEQFEVPGMLDAELVAPLAEAPEPIAGPIAVSNLSLEAEEGSRIVDSASFAFDLSDHVALVGTAGSGKGDVARLLARQLVPSSGQITIGGQNLASLPEAVTGRDIAYVDQDAYIRVGSIADNLLYSLKHLPVNGADGGGNGSADGANAAWRREAMASGNSPYPLGADWIDRRALSGNGADGEAIQGPMVRSLATVGLDDGVFQIGLRSVVDPDLYEGLADGVLAARAVVRDRLQDSAYADLVEVFEAGSFIANATVAENILFGTPVGEAFVADRLGENPHVTEVLDAVGIGEDFVQIGRSVAALMVELFKDLPPGHEFFERFGFVDSEQLPEFQRILGAVATRGLDGLDVADRARLRELPFKLIPARHHLGLISEEMQSRLLEARHLFAETLPDSLAGGIEFFDRERYNRSSSIQDNILFGKIAGAKADSGPLVGALIDDVVAQVGIRDLILAVGLDFDVGVGGKRLSASQRQQLAIARCVVKQPRLMIVNEAAAGLDAPTRAAVFAGLREQMRGRGLIWVDSELEADGFDRVLTVEHGRVSGGDGEAGQAAAAAEAPAAEEESAAGGDGLAREVEMLSGIAFFSGIDRSRLKLIAFTSERHDYDADETVFTQGAIGDRAYVILKGAVDVIIETVNGPRAVAMLDEGDPFGELALLSDAPRTATIRARETTTVLSISKDVFLKVVLENTRISANLTRIIANRLTATMKTYQAGQTIYDTVTGLPNRGLLIDRMKVEVAQAKRSGRHNALMWLEIGDFAQAVDGVSEAVGAKFLTDVTQRLATCIRGSDTLAQLGAGTFGVLMHDIGDDTDANAQLVERRIRRALEQPFSVANRTLRIGDSVSLEVVHLTDDTLAAAEARCRDS